MSTRRQFLHQLAVGGAGSVIAANSAPFFFPNLSVRSTGVSLEEAQELHDRCLIFDAHNDTPVERVARGMNVSSMMVEDRNYQTDVPRMLYSGYDSGAFIVGNGRVANVWVTMEQMLTTIEQNPNELLLVLEPDDIVRAQQSGRVGVMLAIEGIAKWITGKSDILRILHRNGVRMVALTHGEGGGGPEVIETANPHYRRMAEGDTYLQGSRSPYRFCTPRERDSELRNALGLTLFGREILDLNNELGITTDLSHINDRAYFDVLERTHKPVIVSHTAVFSLCNHFRCLTDDQIRALAENGGAMGVVFFSRFLDEEPGADLDTFVRHLAYVADLVGVDYVGVGTDYDGVGEQPVVLEEVSQLVQVTRKMMEYGFSEEEIRKIWGGNFLRLIRENHETA